MPFDGTNFGSEVLRILRIAQDRIAHQWIKGTLVKRAGDGTYRYCMMGSVVCGENGCEENTAERRLALSYVCEAVHRGIPKSKRNGDRDIAERNDLHDTTQHDVDTIMATAVKLREIEEFQHAG